MNSLTILLLILYTIITTTVVTAYEDVLDTDRNPVKPKTPHYILPSNTTQGGGVTLVSKSSTSPCPFNVALETSKDARGTPVKFLYFRSDHIETTYLDVDLNVVFDFGGTKCSEPKGWRLSSESSSSSNYVKTGGEVGLIFQELDWFKIKKVESGVYKFVWCPDFWDRKVESGV